MIKDLELDGNNIIAWRIEGKVEEAEYKPILDSLKERMEASENINIYMEVPEMPGLSLQTVLESLKFGFTNLKEFLESIHKVAVVTDKEWLKTYTSVESRLLPGVEERAFSFEDAEKAKLWLREG